MLPTPLRTPVHHIVGGQFFNQIPTISSAIVFLFGFLFEIYITSFDMQSVRAKPRLCDTSEQMWYYHIDTISISEYVWDVFRLKFF